MVEAIRASGLATVAALEALNDQIKAAQEVRSSADIAVDQQVEVAGNISRNFVKALLRIALALRTEVTFGWKEFRAGIYRYSGPAAIASGHIPQIIAFVIENAEQLRSFVQHAFSSPVLLDVIDAIARSGS